MDDAADGEVIGDEDGDGAERGDGVESDGGADVDEGEERRDREGHGHGGEGDVPAGRNLGEPAVAGQTGVAGERPDLAGGSSDFGHGAGREHDDDDGSHDVGAGVGLGCVVEDLDEGVAGGGFEDACRIAERETKGHDDDEHEDDIEEDGAHNGAREGDGGIFDFFG